MHSRSATLPLKEPLHKKQHTLFVLSRLWEKRCNGIILRKVLWDKHLYAKQVIYKAHTASGSKCRRFISIIFRLCA